MYMFMYMYNAHVHVHVHAIMFLSQTTVGFPVYLRKYVISGSECSMCHPKSQFH
jgi:hypothetical protein